MNTVYIYIHIYKYIYRVAHLVVRRLDSIVQVPEKDAEVVFLRDGAGRGLLSNSSCPVRLNKSKQLFHNQTVLMTLVL